MADLNMKSIHLGESNVASFATKPQAVAFAQSIGWPKSYVTRAANRFSRFWVISKSIGADTLRLAISDGTVRDFPHPGFW